MELEEAVFVLRGYGLKLGEVFYKETGKITVEEKKPDGELVYKEKLVSPGGIFKQVPRAENRTKIGQSVDLWLVKVDSAQLNAEIPSLKAVNND